MPYTAKNGRAIVPYRGKRATKRTRKGKAFSYPRSLTGGYRIGAARALVQQPDLKPSTITVQFTGKMRYKIVHVSDANTKSFLDIPANYIGSIYGHGSSPWYPESYTGAQYITSFDQYFTKYNQYCVLSSQCSVSAEQTDPSTTGQQNMIQALGRANQHSSIPHSTPVMDIEKRYGFDLSMIGGIQSPLKVGFNKIGYRPELQHGVKDPSDSDELTCITTWDASPEKPTYFAYAVGGLLDSIPDGHQELLITVNTSYVCRFSEPTNNNVP